MYLIARIKLLNSGDPDTTIESSSNLMVVTHFAQTGTRGLRAKYRAVAPARELINLNLFINKNRIFPTSFISWYI